MASRLLSRLIWCIPTGVSVLKNLEVSPGCVCGHVLWEFQDLWSWVRELTWWRPWDVYEALGGGPEVQRVEREPALTLRKPKILRPHTGIPGVFVN